ncbi:helicase associated domain-containing protein [Glaciihabitans sp. INWT7]|uniref:helicase associated domain-containing protein n=1 Tax=Glaciihabitans sp. INWT7 TaxID=2596912 RepID=UPI0016240A51|nr:helicase associated domain-containing protein [Glaciihabitans sp. INWT7]
MSVEYVMPEALRAKLLASSESLDALRRPKTPLARQAHWLELLAAFALREGHTNVPQRHEEGGYALGRFVNGQRKAYRAGALSSAWIEALEGLVGWTWDAQADAFASSLALMHSFALREGHADVPRGHIEGGRRLAVFATTQKVMHRAGRLSNERISALGQVTGWTWGVQSDSFTTGLPHLLTFARREGHADVPRGHIEDGFKLGRFAHALQGMYGAGTLSHDRIRRLEQVTGWTWGAHAEAFATATRYLLAFVLREGHADVPQGHIEDGFKLGRFVKSQRAFYNAGTLPEDCIESLESIAGWSWESKSNSFIAALDHLNSFALREGHADVPQNHNEDGFLLGRFVNKQRPEYRANRLSPSRIAALEAVAGWKWNHRTGK